MMKSSGMQKKKEIWNEWEWIETIQLDFCADFIDCLNSNIVRGKRVTLARAPKSKKYIIFEWYSHTATDCPRCSPEEIEKLDISSIMLMHTFNASNDQLAITLFHDFVKNIYFS